jgi:hypothetical protein
LIGVVGGRECAAGAALVDAAFRRSVTYAQSRMLAVTDLVVAAPRITVLVDADDGVATALEQWLRQGARKLIVFGRVPAALAHLLGLEMGGEPIALAEAESPSAPPHAWRESRAEVVYTDRAAVLGGKTWRRAFARFDFTNEWNNLGFGAIHADGDMWSVGAPALVPVEHALAHVEIAGRSAGSYAALADLPDLSLLWFNRPVGPIDSFEWRLVETFISGHRAAELPCQPVLREIPWGYDFASTMRLDCDEDLASVETLSRGYAELGVPLSLAVLATVLDDAPNRDALRGHAAAGGAVLSHSATHAPSWGGSYDTALIEANRSADAIAAVTGQRPAYAISPFHETPTYALEALRDAGYRGCAGGRIGVEPAFVMARGGSPLGLHPGFIGHAQQCMLHGDCLDADGGVAVYEEAVLRAWETATFFAYLDHPFSQRYQYGWDSEAQRLEAHRRLVGHIRHVARNPVFLDENTALDFLRARSLATVRGDADALTIEMPEAPPASLALAVEYRGKIQRVVPGRVLT